MRVGKFLASVAATAVVAGGVALASAPSALAADLGSTTFACLSGPAVEITVSGQVGDTFTAQNTVSFDCTVASSAVGIVSWTTDDPSASGTQDPSNFWGSLNYPATPTIGTTVTFTLLAEGSTTWTATQGGVGLTIYFNVAGAAAGAAADAPPIPAWVQAYGRDGKDATCLEGWSPSWQSWAEPVTGGWVCTRDIPSLG